MASLVESNPAKWAPLPLTKEETEFVVLLIIYQVDFESCARFIVEDRADNPRHALSNHLFDKRIYFLEICRLTKEIENLIQNNSRTIAWSLRQVIDTLIPMVIEKEGLIKSISRDHFALTKLESLNQQKKNSDILADFRKSLGYNSLTPITFEDIDPFAMGLSEYEQGAIIRAQAFEDFFETLFDDPKMFMIEVLESWWDERDDEYREATNVGGSFVIPLGEMVWAQVKLKVRAHEERRDILIASRIAKNAREARLEREREALR